MKMTTEIPAFTAPDKIKTSIGTLKYFDGVPTEKSTKSIYDYLDTSRAVNVYLNSIPALSVNALREGQAAVGADTCNKICIWDSLMDSTTVLLTGNTSTMYAVGFLDLLKDGPTVIDLPPGMLGILDDMAFQYMTDLGVAGPDKGKGGKFLVLPPGYKGDIPKGYFVVPSKTSGVWVFMRGYLDKSMPLEKAIPAASKNIRNTLKVYPLSTKANPPAMEFINVSGKKMHMILPNDYTAFEKLHALIQGEPDDYLGPEAKGMMAAIGIEKGKPFNPDARMKKILNDAMAIANGAARAISYFPRDPGNLTFKDSEAWVTAYADKDTTFTRNGAYRLDPRVLFHFGYICVSPAMAMTVAGKGSDYSMCMLDSKGDVFDGSKTYKLHVPPNPPAKDFWAITMYDTQTRSQLRPISSSRPLAVRIKALKPIPTDRWIFTFLRKPRKAWRATGSRPFPEKAGSLPCVSMGRRSPGSTRPGGRVRLSW